jgi:hypothetical protein
MLFGRTFEWLGSAQLRTWLRDNYPHLVGGQFNAKRRKVTPHKLDTFVRRHESEDGTYTFHTSNGEIVHGTEEQVAERFVNTDRRLQKEGYSRNVAALFVVKSSGKKKSKAA